MAKHNDSKVRGAILDVIPALASVGAGLYMLSSQTVSSDSIFNVFLHGIGVYFIAKGIYMARTSYLQAELVSATRQARDDTKV